MLAIDPVWIDRHTVVSGSDTADSEAEVMFLKQQVLFVLEQAQERLPNVTKTHECNAVVCHKIKEVAMEMLFPQDPAGENTQSRLNVQRALLKLLFPGC